MEVCIMHNGELVRIDDKTIIVPCNSCSETLKLTMEGFIESAMNLYRYENITVSEFLESELFCANCQNRIFGEIDDEE